MVTAQIYILWWGSQKELVIWVEKMQMNEGHTPNQIIMSMFAERAISNCIVINAGTPLSVCKR